MKVNIKTSLVILFFLITYTIRYSYCSANNDNDLITITLQDVNKQGNERPRSLNIVPLDCYYFNGQINLNYIEPITGSVTVCVVGMSNGKVWQDSFDAGAEDAFLTVSKERGDYYVTISISDAVYEGYYSLFF